MKIIKTLLLFLLPLATLAQWNTGSGIVYTTYSSIGIGTSTPSNLQSWNTVLDVNAPMASKILSTSANQSHRTGIFTHSEWYGGGGFVGTESNHNLFFVTNYDAKAVITTSGNVGIGINTPQAKLHVTGKGCFTGGVEQSGAVANNNNAAFTNSDATGYGLYSQGGAGTHYAFHFLNQPGQTILYGGSNGNIGIGSISSNARLQIYNPAAFNTNEAGAGQDHILFSSASPGAGGFFGGLTWESGGRRRASIAASLEHTDEDYVGLAFFTKGTDGSGPIGESMRITRDGNVGIGTATPDATLAVNGHIHTREVIVDLTGAVAPDYVFEPDYDLKPLSEVESYIKANKHLPEVPSAKEMEEEGLNLKEMNLILLRKIEEMILHLIEQEKRIDELSKRSVSPDSSGKKVEELTLHLIELERKYCSLIQDKNNKQ